MVSWIVGLRGKSFSCEGVYMFINSHGWSIWFVMRIIWRHGDKSAGVDISVRSPMNAYFLCTSVSNPPLCPTLCPTLCHIAIYSSCDVCM